MEPMKELLTRAQVLNPVPDLVPTAQIVPILFSDKLDSLVETRMGSHTHASAAPS